MPIESDLHGLRKKVMFLLLPVSTSILIVFSKFFLCNVFK